MTSPRRIPSAPKPSLRIDDKQEPAASRAFSSKVQKALQRWSQDLPSGVNPPEVRRALEDALGPWHVAAAPAPASRRLALGEELSLCVGNVPALLPKLREYVRITRGQSVSSLELSKQAMVPALGPEGSIALLVPPALSQELGRGTLASVTLALPAEGTRYTVEAEALAADLELRLLAAPGARPEVCAFVGRQTRVVGTGLHPESIVKRITPRGHVRTEAMVHDDAGAASRAGESKAAVPLAGADVPLTQEEARCFDECRHGSDREKFLRRWGKPACVSTVDHLGQALLNLPLPPGGQWLFLECHFGSKARGYLGQLQPENDARVLTLATNCSGQQPKCTVSAKDPQVELSTLVGAAVSGEIRERSARFGEQPWLVLWVRAAQAPPTIRSAGVQAPDRLGPLLRLGEVEAARTLCAEEMAGQHPAALQPALRSAMRDAMKMNLHESVRVIVDMAMALAERTAKPDVVIDILGGYVSGNKAEREGVLGGVNLALDTGAGAALDSFVAALEAHRDSLGDERLVSLLVGLAGSEGMDAELPSAFSWCVTPAHPGDQRLSRTLDDALAVSVGYLRKVQNSALPEQVRFQVAVAAASAWLQYDAALDLKEQMGPRVNPMLRLVQVPGAPPNGKTKARAKAWAKRVLNVASDTLARRESPMPQEGKAPPAVDRDSVSLPASEPPVASARAVPRGPVEPPLGFAASVDIPPVELPVAGREAPPPLSRPATDVKHGSGGGTAPGRGKPTARAGAEAARRGPAAAVPVGGHVPSASLRSDDVASTKALLRGIQAGCRTAHCKGSVFGCFTDEEGVTRLAYQRVGDDLFVPHAKAPTHLHLNAAKHFLVLTTRASSHHRYLVKHDRALLSNIEQLRVDGHGIAIDRALALLAPVAAR